ncbi:MAG: transcriptional regulator [Actinobacteria bacterium RBG_13_35_12]|nr:MAG: transcriptional regulator [Actinobacteria bacterium RBG_13_35_12]
MDIKIYKALSDESRLKILNLLIQQELCVCEIEVILDMSQSNVSRHLNKLKSAKIVVYKKESQWAYYTISNMFIEDNNYLYEHLKNKFSFDDQLLEDLDKLNSLKKQHAICDEIRGNKIIKND